ncbi:DUF1002 domain-containing protein [Lysinibacillus sphaericus]|uniref:Extracellular protein n=1 Tax=Lysinibacillus sphaericus TaxID=1421 RepID=A0A2S0JVR6_LYSSH|nr:DUF1002 domain-containing protein [Lysinibacillus sphaericus]AVK95232.1 hypothetical protein LS41612_02465 [Lysinibacillus sphaericus]MCS1381663.1 DUF1002 domain-containing protein [Lysinibacillus sphaericus]MED4545124.1 DUF1002 domain-containing protein [Lysinibacillus sphaericus]TKI18593.1 DUF1002 domain-containing protein [Lysinibacillus sphaericus]UDK98610.1 DUF1002 domain-containing protein [Lysinibacillus sphaericus]
MKKIWGKMLVATMLVFGVLAPTTGFAADNTTPDNATPNAIDEKLGVPIVVYGANLSEAEKDSVKKSLKVNENPEVEEITVSGNDLAKYIKDSNASSRMYSSAKITRKDAGKGLVIEIVTPSNITQVTSEMYANAMLTAGIEDATVQVAAPKAVTGHSALVGIYKAYEVTTGKTLDIERTDVANEELSVATTIADSAGVDDAKVAELLTEIKKQIAELKPATREDVEKIVQEQLDKLEINLSEQDRQLLVDLMDKISKLDIDFSKWSEQLDDISNTIQEKFGALMEDEGFWTSVKNFFADLKDTVSTWFN